MEKLCVVDNKPLHIMTTGALELSDGNYVCNDHFKKAGFSKFSDSTKYPRYLTLESFRAIYNGETTAAEFRKSVGKTSIVTETQQEISNNVYQKSVKRNLKPKDGFMHVLMINSFSKFMNQNFEVESKYTTQIDEIVTNLQKDGYEIIDIKFDSLKDQGISKQAEGFHTLITYK